MTNHNLDKLADEILSYPSHIAFNMNVHGQHIAYPIERLQELVKE